MIAAIIILILIWCACQVTRYHQHRCAKLQNNAEWVKTTYLTIITLLKNAIELINIRIFYDELNLSAITDGIFDCVQLYRYIDCNLIFTHFNIFEIYLFVVHFKKPSPSYVDDIYNIHSVLFWKLFCKFVIKPNFFSFRPFSLRHGILFSVFVDIGRSSRMHTEQFQIICKTMYNKFSINNGTHDAQIRSKK